jgi:hypothetical protein
MTRSPFTAATAGPPSTVATGIEWSTVRGAFVVSGTSTPATPTTP